VDVGPAELIIVLLIVLLIFGGAKLPKLARSMGQAAHEFRKGLAHGDDDAEAAPDQPETAEARTASDDAPPAPPVPPTEAPD
jgi:sec-independent protein translocase protein TatA